MKLYPYKTILSIPFFNFFDFVHFHHEQVRNFGANDPSIQIQERIRHFLSGDLENGGGFL